MRLPHVILACVLSVNSIASAEWKTAFTSLFSQKFKLWKQGTDVYMRSLGFEFEWRSFVTEDGQRIVLHHFWKGRNNESGIPILLAHSLLANGDVWLLGEPDECFAMLLADCGYDMWAVNFRGSKYSNVEGHRSYSLDDPIRHDLPEAIDYILGIRNRKNLHIIGGSKGTTTSFGLLSSRPEYNKKVRLLVGIVPLTYMEDPPFLLKMIFTALGQLTKKYSTSVQELDSFIREFNSSWFLRPLRLEFTAHLLQILATLLPELKNIVVNAIIASQISTEGTHYDHSYAAIGFHNVYPDVISHNELYHYAQTSCVKNFQSFNYSQFPEELRKRNTITTYNMTEVTAATIFLEANNDICSQPRDYARLRAQLKNLLGAYLVIAPNFLHIDPALGARLNTIYGRAFTSLFLEFDSSEHKSICRFDFTKESANLRKMEVDEVAEKHRTKFPGNWITNFVESISNIYTKDYCKYFGG